MQLALAEKFAEPLIVVTHNSGLVHDDSDEEVLAAVLAAPTPHSQSLVWMWNARLDRARTSHVCNTRKREQPEQFRSFGPPSPPKTTPRGTAAGQV